jgi:hypothetical protein
VAKPPYLKCCRCSLPLAVLLVGCVLASVVRWVLVFQWASFEVTPSRRAIFLRGASFLVSWLVVVVVSGESTIRLAGS